MKPHQPAPRFVAATITAFVTSAALLPVTTQAQEAGFPSKPIRYVVGQAPGGATDLVARAVAQKVSESAGQSVIVENRTGAAGSIGAAHVAKSATDGYTVLVISSSYSINPSLYASLPFDPLKDLMPITLLAEAPFLMVVHPSMPVRTVRDFLGLAKAKPDALNFASGGTGSSGHLAGELFKNLSGVKMVHVPYKGAGPALVDVISGQVHLTFASMLSSLSHVRVGKLKPLGVTSTRRSQALPDLPTVAEGGLPGYATTTWYGLLAPAGSRPALIGWHNAEAKKALSQPEVHKRFMGDGAEPVGESPEHFRKFLAAEIAKWRKVVAQAAIKSQ